MSVVDYSKKAILTSLNDKLEAEDIENYVATPEVPTTFPDDLTTVTHTAPGAADYAIQDLVQPAGYGFVTKDEGNTVLAVIANLQAQVAAMGAALIAAGIMAAEE